jgi:hypothetical protein
MEISTLVSVSAWCTHSASIEITSIKAATIHTTTAKSSSAHTSTTKSAASHTASHSTSHASTTHATASHTTTSSSLKFFYKRDFGSCCACKCILINFYRGREKSYCNKNNNKFKHWKCIFHN